MNSFRPAVKNSAPMRALVYLLLGAPFAPLARAQQSAFANYAPTITTVAGTGVSGSTVNGTPANMAKLANPASIGWDNAGNLYILDKNKAVVLEVSASSDLINTIVGQSGVTGYIDGVPGTQAELSTPGAITVDSAGNVYIADTKNNRVRKWTNSTGIINTVAGSGSTTYSGNGGPALAAGINGPTGVSVDAFGNIYISDAGDDVLRVVYEGGPIVAVPGLVTAAAALTPSTPQVGSIYTIAGTYNTATSTGNGGPAIAATISGPNGASLDSHNNLYLTDKTHNNLRRVGADNDLIVNIAGNGTAGGTGDGGPATVASLLAPSASRQDLQGNAFIVDTSNDVIRVVNPQSQGIYTIAGQIGIAATFATDGDGGFSTGASLNGPTDVSYSSTGVLAIADSGLHVVRAVTPPTTNFAATAVGAASTTTTYNLSAVKADTFTGINIQQMAADFTLASTGCTLPASVTAGLTNCAPAIKFTPTAPGMRTSQLVTTDSSGDKAILQLTGIGNSPAVAISPGIISTIAGTPATPGSSGDGGLATSATVNAPAGISIDSAGNTYIAGADNKIRVVAPSGTIATFAGTGTAGFSGDYGPANAAQLSNPTAVAQAPNGDIYVADTGNNVVRMVGAESGVIRSVTIPGMLNSPKGLAFDVTGNLYIADSGNNVIREVSRYANFYTTLAGTAGTGGKTGDGGAATSALLNAPAGIAFDSAGNLYIADSGNNEVRKITASTGIISTVAGNGSLGNTGDGGLATSATLSTPSQVAVDAAGDIYIACAGSSTIRMVSAATGIITTVAGSGTAGTGGDGALATAAFLNGPLGLALDAKNDLFIADTKNQRIAEVPGSTTTETFPAIPAGHISSPQTVTVTNFGNQSLSLSGLAVSSSFTQTASGGTDCGASTTLSPGASCLVSLQFLPASAGTTNGTLTLTDNALGVTGSTQVVQLVGTGQTNTATPANVLIVSGNNQTAGPYATFATPLQVRIVDQNGLGIANVAVTFTAPASGATANFSNATNSITVNSGSGGLVAVPFTALGVRGTFNITAKVSAVSTPATFTETIAGTLLPVSNFSFTPSTNPAVYGQSITLTVSLSPPAGTTPITGTVTLSDGGATIQTVAVNNNVATYSLIPSAGTHSYTFAYSGDTNYSMTSSSAPLALTITQRPLTAIATSVTFPFGTPTLPTLTGQLNGLLPSDVNSVILSLSTTPTYSNVLPVGVYQMMGSLSGTSAGNYQLTSTTGTVTVTPAPVMISLTDNLPYPGTSTPVTFTATVVSNVTGIPTGTTASDPPATVTFYDGPTVIGSASTGTGGVATLKYTFVTVGTQTITAVVTPGNYGPGTSNAVSVAVSAPGISLATDAPSYAVVQGQQAAVTLTTLAVGGLASTVTYACSGLPANSVCVFTPASFTPTPTASPAIYQNVGLIQINTAGPGAFHSQVRSPLQKRSVALAAIFAFPASLIFGFLTWRRRRVAFVQIALVILGAMVMIQLSGCGGNVSNPAQTVTTPTGMSTITITATSGTVTSSTTVTLNVTAAP